jgi:error-prone DNA polymerase
MIGVRGRIQREGEVVHLVAHHLTDLSAELASVGARDTAFSPSRGGSAEIHHASPGPDLSNMPDPHLELDEIKVKTRNFR